MLLSELTWENSSIGSARSVLSGEFCLGDFGYEFFNLRLRFRAVTSVLLSVLV